MISALRMGGFEISARFISSSSHVGVVGYESSLFVWFVRLSRTILKFADWCYGNYSYKF